MQNVYLIRKLVINIFNKKKLLSYTLCIFLTLFLILLSILCVIKYTILNKEYVKQQLNSSNYYTDLYNIIQDGFNNYILQSGFDNKILDNIITISSITDDVNNLIDSLFAGSIVNISTSIVQDTLHANIENFISEHNYIVDDETSSNIKIFEDSIIDVYINNIVYSENIVNTISTFMPKVQKLFTIAIIALVVLSIVLAILVFILNKASLGISLVSSGLLLIFSHFYSYINIAINNILILNKAFSTFVSHILNIILNNLFIIGIVGLIIGLIIIILASNTVFKNRKMLTD